MASLCAQRPSPCRLSEALSGVHGRYSSFRGRSEEEGSGAGGGGIGIKTGGRLEGEVTRRLACDCEVIRLDFTLKVSPIVCSS